ncbi:lysophospholipase L1-like esterase [Sphingobacterium allocomposti]|jgi:lysophospholipase L1-like esterase|uniref:Lysophospholipase L1-like esterase n=1 Tax=Sphingobacterium allocomposti TaxID=415956 RepID=A0A5S5DL17_9SPHI|nr:SGNH/GDSL hydrolase family protein [Sphingobacterium composti Yoo et al. 2007 non Ten et al. 2007]TYP96395.1 lysophospholipase L1-like esterase [Sphingobacterium composti Yoo et al. 2007 non Ten et al. 2007]HLS95759.1 SGNH/GDSL hydrolase family protein [Sphingobacterium sp.]
MESRRTFLAKGLLALGATMTMSEGLLAADASLKPASKITVKPNDVILFQGDSITDAGRKRDNLEANNTAAFGNGYAMIAGSCLLNKYADKNIQIYNRGISGNRVPDLLDRWDTDTLALRPTVLSILIGVNDFWRTKDRGAQNTPAQYKQQYQQLIERTLKALPDVRLIIGEPFGVKGVKHVNDDWYPDFLGYQQAAKEVAKEFNAIFLPYQTVFDKAASRGSGDYWTTDGVHTSLAGANLMAQAWLDVIK